jgi:S1-C subfamily serine protease
VAEGFPASLAGLQLGDVIVEMAGQPIPNTGQLSKFLISHLPGETVEITYYRGLDRRTLGLTLVEQPQRVR